MMLQTVLSPCGPFRSRYLSFEISGKNRLLCFFLLFFSSCYSVRMSVKDASPVPAGPVASNEGYWRDKQMLVVDTCVRLGVLNNEVMYLASCPGGFHTIEYKVSLGHVLLSAITLGKVRKIKVKYACVKPLNN